MPYSDLQSFVRALESADELRRIETLVDPYLEIAEIYDRVIKREGPALLFENVRGSDHPLLINPLGSSRRIELALGRHPGEMGASLLDLAADDYVNSLRGTQKSGSRLDVSTLYEETRAFYFPDFEQDVRTHTKKVKNSQTADEGKYSAISNRSPSTAADWRGWGRQYRLVV